MKQAPAHLTALITGASVGIGRELARVFARHGHALVLVARNEVQLNQLADELRAGFGISVRVLPMDLSAPTAARHIVAALQRDSIQIDCLVNNAGVDVYGNFWETDLADELRLIQINLISLTQLTKLLLPEMLAQGYGRILNLASTGSFVPSPLNAVYTATKAYVLNFSQAIAEELDGHGITVTAVCPGATRTEFQARAKMESVPLLRFGVLDAARVAEIAYRGMMAGRRVVVPGWYSQLQVLSARLLPGGLLTKIAKSMLQK